MPTLRLSSERSWRLGYPQPRSIVGLLDFETDGRSVARIILGPPGEAQRSTGVDLDDDAGPLGAVVFGERERRTGGELPVDMPAEPLIEMLRFGDRPPQFLLCAGAKGKRFALPHSRILMHQPLGQMQGKASDIKIHAEQLARTKEQMADLIAEMNRPAPTA